jgi:hypothetical protein
MLFKEPLEDFHDDRILPQVRKEQDMYGRIAGFRAQAPAGGFSPSYFLMAKSLLKQWGGVTVTKNKSLSGKTFGFALVSMSYDFHVTSHCRESREINAV